MHGCRYGSLMRTLSRVPLRRTLLAIAAGAALVGCSSGPGAVEKSEVEKVAATELAAQVGADEPPNISCPGDLEAEVGTTMTCELSVEGDEDVYPVEIEVTSVDGDDVKFDVQVDDTPSGD